jgi:hypothetical protein
MESSEEARALSFRNWHQEMNNILIERGIQGYGQKAILRYFKQEPKEEVIGYLEMLLKENKVQKFKYGSDFIWRATTEILV